VNRREEGEKNTKSDSARILDPPLPTQHISISPTPTLPHNASKYPN
jgi:hypothetical protein